METESTKTTGTHGEAKTGGKEGSFIEMCMNCCGDPAKMEQMSKMMKSCCSEMSKMGDKGKMMKRTFL